MSTAARDCEELSELQAEILQEKAETLLRISRTLCALLEELEELGLALPELSGQARRHAVARFNQRREDAELWFWYLLVQREAVGLRRSRGLEEFYPIPVPIRE